MLKDEIEHLKDTHKYNLPNFADCEIGYEPEVYPNVPFSYKVNEDCIVHFDRTIATLTAKNKINEGSLLTESFYPYVVTFVIEGNIEDVPPLDSYGVMIWINLESNQIV